MTSSSGASRPGVLATSIAIDLVYLLIAPVFVVPYLIVLLFIRRRAAGDWGQRLGSVPSRKAAPGRRIWFHTVSVGEFEAAWPLLERLRSERPDLDLVVSATTATGYELAVSRLGRETVFYFPLDFGLCVRRTLRRTCPDLMVLVELELWPNHILSCERAGIPVLVVNGRVSARGHRRMRRVRWLFARLLRAITHFSVQIPDYAERLADLGAPGERITIDGNLKFDRAPGRDPAALRAEFEREYGAGLRWIAGSTHPGEEEQVIEVHERLRARFPGVGLILAPRHIERADAVAQRIEARGLTVARYRDRKLADVILVDEMGRLGELYAVADVAFVGGSLVPIGGHNILEPIGVGTPVVHGPEMQNFREEVRLFTEAGAAAQVAKASDLERVVGAWLADPGERERRRALAAQTLELQRGSLERALVHILGSIPESLPLGSRSR